MVNWDVIDNVFLDMDGTLLDLHFDNYFWLEHLPVRYAHIKDQHPSEVRQFLTGQYDKLRGKLDWYCLEYWQRQLEVDIVDLKREISDKIQLRPNVLAFLKALRKAGKHVALVSNAHPWSIALKVEQVLPADYFDAIHSSHDFGHPKEEQEFWQGLHTEKGFDAARTLFIDDNEDVLSSAERYGIGHLLGICQPDMKLAPMRPGRFRQIHDFEDLI